MFARYLNTTSYELNSSSNQKICIMVSDSGVVLANAELEVGAFLVLLLADKADLAGLFVFALGQHFAEWRIIKIFHVV